MKEIKEERNTYNRRKAQKKGRNERNCIRRYERKKYKEKREEINIVEAGKYDGSTKENGVGKKDKKLRISK